MREIKFRAWDKETNSMHKVKEISFNNDGSMDGLLGDVIGRLYFNERVLVKGNRREWIDDISLLQYAGLKDKNGVEIYEGDVVEYKTVHEWDKKPMKRRRVVFENGMFNPPGVIVDLSRTKIIGNVYENPELLEG